MFLNNEDHMETVLSIKEAQFVGMQVKSFSEAALLIIEHSPQGSLASVLRKQWKMVLFKTVFG